VKGVCELAKDRKHGFRVEKRQIPGLVLLVLMLMLMDRASFGLASGARVGMWTAASMALPVK
jgi:hypothetical protein